MQGNDREGEQKRLQNPRGGISSKETKRERGQGTMSMLGETVYSYRSERGGQFPEERWQQGTKGITHSEKLLDTFEDGIFARVYS